MATFDLSLPRHMLKQFIDPISFGFLYRQRARSSRFSLCGSIPSLVSILIHVCKNCFMLERNMKGFQRNLNLSSLLANFTIK